MTDHIYAAIIGDDDCPNVTGARAAARVREMLLSDAAVERGARAGWDACQEMNCWHPDQTRAPWPPAVSVQAMEYREEIRAALLAAMGGSDA